MDILFWKWFLVDLNFRVPNLEEDELEENLLTEARRRNLLLGLGTQSQDSPTDMEESLNPKHPMGETCHPQQDELEPKTILPTLRS